MAEDINDAKVADLAEHRAKKGRGKAKAKAAPPPVADDGEERAPGLGHNQPTEGQFLRWVQRLRAHDALIDDAKLKLKDLRGQRKDLRSIANGEGLVMRELDDALADLNTDQVDLEAREERRRLYRMWLGLPAGVQPNLPLPKNDAEAEAQRWLKRGELDGRLGKKRENPEGCPPERLQDYFKGWEIGQEALMRGADLTKDAFMAVAGIEPAPALAHVEGAPAATKPVAGAKDIDGKQMPAEKPVLILNEADFATGTALDDANLRTLMDGRRAEFDAADRVVALFGSKKRILKEPDTAFDSGYYVDDGEEAPVSLPEPADAPGSPTAAELA